MESGYKFGIKKTRLSITLEDIENPEKYQQWITAIEYLTEGDNLQKMMDEIKTEKS